VAVTLAECAFDTGGIGLDVDLPATGDAIATLFGESSSRAIVSVSPAERPALAELAAELGVPFRVIGRTGGSRLRMEVSGAPAVDCAVSEAEQTWTSAIERHFAGRAA
jgi:phosphoribosylformylglycinamidine synthase